MVHLTDQQIAQYRQRILPTADLLDADDHLADCRQCRERLQENVPDRIRTLEANLRAASQMGRARRPAAGRSILWLAGAAAGLILGIVGYQLSRTTGPQRALPAEYESAIARAVATKRVEAPEVVSRLNTKDGTLLSGTAPRVEEPITLLAPVGTALMDDRPFFRWTALAGAESYSVAIYDEQLQRVAFSPAITATEWRPTTGLQRGVVLSWQVTAKRAGESIRVPVPPKAEARFLILSREVTDSLQKTAREYPEQHLLMGVLYAQAGALDDAERAFEAAKVPELLESVRSMRSKTVPH
jgi:hypothetical protein